VVEQAVVAANICDHDPTRTYQIDWKTLIETTRATRAGNESIVGFYHSHPDGSSKPSPSDQQHAWVGYSYLIVPISGAGTGEVTSWRVPSEGARFEQESIVVL